jgi:hypothetical protein
MPDQETNDRGVSKRWPKLKRTAIWLASLVLVLTIAAELVARFYLGLGDPPLFIADAQIEYLYKPSSEYHRFGNRIAFNSYSMRSDEFPAHKTNPDEFRVIVMGDSVINGGSQTDQSQLATSILQAQLKDDLKRPVIVGNVSAGSWGPPNLLAYAKRYGFFDADAVIIVLSSHDYADAPTFAPVVGVSPTMPDRSPALALTDALQRYVLPRLRRSIQSGDAVPPEPGPESARIALGDLARLLELAKEDHRKVLVFHHCEKTELDGQFKPGRAEIEEVVQKSQLELRDWCDSFKEKLQAGEDPYRDYIHPDAIGQQAIAKRVRREVLKVVAP